MCKEQKDLKAYECVRRRRGTRVLVAKQYTSYTHTLVLLPHTHTHLCCVVVNKSIDHLDLESNRCMIYICEGLEDCNVCVCGRERETHTQVERVVSTVRFTCGRGLAY